MIGSFFSGAWGHLASEVANHLWQSTLFALLAGLLTLALKKNRGQGCELPNSDPCPR